MNQLMIILDNFNDNKSQNWQDNINWELYDYLIRTSVIFLNNVIDKNKYPLQEIDTASKITRKVGLGGMGFHDMLLKLGIPYDSEKALEIVTTAVQNTVATTENDSVNSSDKFFSPLVKSIALKEGITSAELEKIVGTGLAGRVTKKDVIAYIENRGAVTATAAPTVETVTATTNQPVATPTIASDSKSFLSNIKEPIVVPNPGDEIIEMDRMRKIIAEHMVMSSHVSPHVTSYVEADVTNIVNWRNKTKKEFEKREGENLTFTPIFMEAIVKAIKDFPMINVSVSGTTIIKRKDINIGMATALPSGNLIGPVIKNADRMNLTGIAKSVNQLARNARDNKLKPEDIQGGTYTVTNDFLKSVYSQYLRNSRIGNPYILPEPITLAKVPYNPLKSVYPQTKNLQPNLTNEDLTQKELTEIINKDTDMFII